MLRLAENKREGFCIVTRNFTCLLLVSRVGQEHELLVMQFSTCESTRMHGWNHFIVNQTIPQRIIFVSIVSLPMFLSSFNEKGKH